MRKVINGVLFYGCWFAVVIAAANGWPIIAVAAALVVIAIHLGTARDWRRESLVLLVAGAAGFVIETGLMHAGFATYAAPGPLPTVAPIWLVLLWMAFATTFNVSLSAIRDRPVIAAVLGALGGPLAYYGGMRIGAMDLTQPLLFSLAAIGGAYAVATPALMAVARRLDGA